MANYNYSVVIPYRDKYDMLVKAVASIPDRDDVQIIIIDNSVSPLPNEKVPVKEKAKVLFTISSPTKGAGCARNVGLKHVEGRFIVFLDADDYFTPTAFISFDKYLDSNYDIIYFDADSIRLIDGAKSDRHLGIHQYIESFLKDGNENQLRYRFVNPIAKMIRTELVNEHCILFDEVKVSNDVMFSIYTGYYAKSVSASRDIVYVITEGEKGTTLTKSRNAENQFIRFQVTIKRFLFLTEVGKKEHRPRLLGAFRIALFNYGPKEFLRYVRYAKENNVNIFK
jgi:glycosyltransferase involved in cell wall biosynthesis